MAVVSRAELDRRNADWRDSLRISQLLSRSVALSHGAMNWNAKVANKQFLHRTLYMINKAAPVVACDFLTDLLTLEVHFLSWLNESDTAFPKAVLTRLVNWSQSTIQQFPFADVEAKLCELVFPGRKWESTPKLNRYFSGVFFPETLPRGFEIELQTSGGLQSDDGGCAFAVVVSNDDGEVTARLPVFDDVGLFGRVDVEPPLRCVYELLHSYRDQIGELLGPTVEAVKGAVVSGYFVPTKLQTDILRALDGKALKKQPLADAACGGDASRLYKPGKGKPGGIHELRDLGKVDHRDGVGYFRPDRPPKSL